MPRKYSIVWKHFRKCTKGKYVTGKCNYSGEVYISNAKRMKRHIAIKYNNAPNVIKKLFSENKEPKSVSSLSLLPTEDNVDNNGNITCDTDIGVEISNQQDSVSGRGSSCSNMLGFLDFLQPKDKEKLDTLFARAIYATSTPLRIAEDPYWISFFKHLRPAYQPPSRYQLSNSLLDREYSFIQNQIKIKIENADALTLVSDGWTDNTGNSLINILFCTPTPVFFKAVDSKMEPHTGKYITKYGGCYGSGWPK
jgi:hypothetical protein